MSSHLLERAISFWKSGQKEQARKIFEALVHNDKYNDAAWIWYIYSLNTDREKIAALGTFLGIFPDHAIGKKALTELKAKNADSSFAFAETGTKSHILASLPQAKFSPPKSVQPTQKQTPVSLPWILLTAGICLFFIGSAIFTSRYKSMQASYEDIKTREALISNNYDQLAQEYQTLASEKDALAAEHNTLVSQYNTLNDEYGILLDNYDTLYAENTQLIEKYNSLAGDYRILENIAIKPPYIVVHDRMVDTTFYDTNGQLITWTTPFAGLEYDIEYGAYMRRLIVDEEWKTVRVYTEYNDAIWIRDFSDFITPDTFEYVVPQLYNDSSSAYNFVYRLWYIIGQLANYASEDLETPRYSLETLLAGGGDCEDLSILLASLVQAAPVDWYVDLVYVDSENINNPQSPDHVVVYINTGQETFIVETTSDQEMLPYHNGITGWLAGDLSSSSSNEIIYPRYLH